MRPEAIAALEQVAFRRITKIEANKYSNRGFVAATLHLNYYLIRAVRLNPRGRLGAYLRGASIHIVDGDLGADRPSVKSAVVVAVKGKILRAYASCEVAE